MEVQDIKKIIVYKGIHLVLYNMKLLVFFCLQLVIGSHCFFNGISISKKCHNNVRLYQSFQEYLKVNANSTAAVQSSPIPSSPIPSSPIPSSPIPSSPIPSSPIPSSPIPSSPIPSSPIPSSPIPSSPIPSSPIPSSPISKEEILAETSTIKISLVSSPSSSSNLPSLIFLPGLDGKGDYSYQAFANLTSSFKIYKMTVDPSDRSTFLEVTDLIIAAISRLDSKPILMGESMGGLFATYVAFRRPNKISKLILVNPATSYERSGWPVFGQIIANTPKQIFPLVGISTLLLTAVEIDQFTRIGQSIVSQINSTETAVQVFNSLLDSANNVTTLLAPDTLNWRLTKWLAKGNFYLDNRFEKIDTPTIILVGNRDRLLPSLEEGRRLKKLMKNAKVELIELEEKGHAILDGSYDLAELLLTSKTFLRDIDSSEVYCPPPNSIDIKNAEKQAGNLIKAVSPVFLTRRKDGVIVKGIDDIPTGSSTGRPVLLVGNHQLYGADLAIIIKEFLDSKDELVRGLAHPVLFTDTDSSARSGGMGDPNVRELFQTFGAVKVSPKAIFELLKRNETVLLFPGGGN